MPDTVSLPSSSTVSPLPGAAVLWRVQRLLGWAIGAAFAYSLIGGASKATCAGGVTGDGGYLDGAGRATDAAPLCLTVTLEPSGFAYAVIAVIVFATTTGVVRRAVDPSDAIRRLDRAVVGIVVFVLAWTLITQASFAGISLESWDGAGPFFLEGIRFGNIVTDVSPMAG
ncbi:hypothetical protein [Agromyces binzhouensis]|uniref:Uncharacterized protein n=1 Tax=Agromyces binzhouensis TaxID=1817495 RepID=A0A4Q2JLV1_9MICO|nr:hypothetical protein [Agromyces binzhouensis]RXZ47080.1 hypothetical protein ESO86_09470 [Agromyces binzhouensis]